MSSCRNCGSIDICESLTIHCIQIEQDSSTECSGLPSGYSRVGVTAAGLLQICSNIDGICECLTFASDDGAIEDTFTDNGDGTITHVSNQGTAVTVNICSLLQYCNLTDIGDVTGPALPGQILIFDGTNWIPTTGTVEENTSLALSACSAGITWNEGEIPGVTTVNLDPVSILYTNPSATRSMSLQIVWTNYGADFSFQIGAGPFTARLAIGGIFTLDGVPQNNYFAYDSYFARVNYNMPNSTIEHDHSGQSYTTTLILPPGGAVTIAATATFDVVTPISGVIASRITIDPNCISVLGVTI